MSLPGEGHVFEFGVKKSVRSDTLHRSDTYIQQKDKRRFDNHN